MDVLAISIATSFLNKVHWMCSIYAAYKQKMKLNLSFDVCVWNQVLSFNTHKINNNGQHTIARWSQWEPRYSVKKNVRSSFSDKLYMVRFGRRLFIKVFRSSTVFYCLLLSSTMYSTYPTMPSKHSIHFWMLFRHPKKTKTFKKTF